ncbi:uncharacterized protein LOC108667514 [Hyalella azteca]|uniref:Uncharacterized protein LOC108667514 n=1 Tax=Hyalella azteca TaxID=294128 RepID=A0A8B7N865_HYAAZ|nr:uncharacterized protein LOC108667514 [Hyalella azteca]
MRKMECLRTLSAFHFWFHVCLAFYFVTTQATCEALRDEKSDFTNHSASPDPSAVHDSFTGTSLEGNATVLVNDTNTQQHFLNDTNTQQQFLNDTNTPASGNSSTKDHFTDLQHPAPIGCTVSYFSSKTVPCALALEYRGSPPAWFLKEHLPDSLSAISTTLLSQFGSEQVCGCRRPDLSSTCPPDLHQAAAIITAACPEA